MKHLSMAILGLTAAALVTGSLSSASPAQDKASGTSLGPDCRSLTLVDAAQVSHYSRPSVCVVTDPGGNRFYLFSGVFRFVAGQPVQARSGLALSRAAIVPVAGYQGADPSDTYYGYGVIEPDGQIRIEGTRNGQAYTVSVSGQIPAGTPPH